MTHTHAKCTLILTWTVLLLLPKIRMRHFIVDTVVTLLELAIYAVVVFRSCLSEGEPGFTYIIIHQ